MINAVKIARSFNQNNQIHISCWSMTQIMMLWLPRILGRRAESHRDRLKIFTRKALLEIVNVSIGCVLIKMECISYAIMMLRECGIMGWEGLKRGCRKSSRETTLLNFEYHPPYVIHSNKKCFWFRGSEIHLKFLHEIFRLWCATTWYF